MMIPQPDDDAAMASLYEAIGRVVVPAAQIEQALATLAMAARGGSQHDHKKTHGWPAGALMGQIKKEAGRRPSEWWSAQVHELFPRLEVALERRNRYVHGRWVSLEGLEAGPGYTVFKPIKTTKNTPPSRVGRWGWEKVLNLEIVLELADELNHLRSQLGPIADRLYEEVLDLPSPPQDPA